MRILKLTFVIFTLACLVCSCDDFKDSTDYSVIEPDKQLEGSWYIKSASRNEIDITKQMDFSKFKLILKADQTYEIENYLPFLVREKGTWSIDEPKFPSIITFKEDGADTEKVSSFQYLIKEGEREIVLTFTPGYFLNSYTYTLKKQSN